MSGDGPIPDGLIIVSSRLGPAETLERLERALTSRGLAIFARIDHAAGAKSVGLDLPPTDVVIFGSPQSGTPLMQNSETIGLELPLKVLVRRQANGETILAYDDPAWLAKRFAVPASAAPIVAKMQAALAAVAAEAAGG